MSYRSTSGVGVLPLIPIIAAGGGAAALYAAQRTGGWFSYWAEVLGQSTGAVADPRMNPAPAPQFQPPPAPQTAAKMTTWSPADVAEVQAHRTLQYQADTDYLRDLMSEAKSTAPSVAASSGGAGLWLLLAAGLGVFILIRR